MAPPRIPFAQTISTRDSTMQKDAILWNYYSSHSTDGRDFADRRFGVQVVSGVTAGAGLGLFAFGSNLLSIVGSNFYVNGVSQGTVDTTSPYQFVLTGQGATAVFLKNNAKAYTWNGTTLTQVTDANYPAATVPGVAYLDGYVFVQDTSGKLWNCNLNTPATWNALNFISGSLAADPGAAVSRLYNYVVSFGLFSATFFYDAGNTPPGSPLLPNISAAVNVGCAAGTSVVATENTVFWVGQTRQKGRSVYMMNGLVPQPISDQFIDKVLNNDPLTNVYAFFVKTNGHAFYVLTLTASNATLVYDTVSGKWHRWSTTGLGTTLNASSASLANNIVTVVLPGHGLTNGVVVKIGSSNSSAAYLGTVVPTIIDANTFTYPVSTAFVGGVNQDTINTRPINADSIASSRGTGLGQLTVTPYVQNYFAQVFYAYANNTDYLLGVADGQTYRMQQSISTDNGMFIYGLLRTNAGDFGTSQKKFFSRMELIGDKVQDTAYLGYSDDDFITWSRFRPINIGADRALLRRGGSARRRSFALLYIGGFQVRFYELELDVEEGDA